MTRWLPAAVALAALAMCGGAAAQEPAVDPLHKRLLTLDTHLDTPVHFGRAGWSFGERHDAASDVAQLDLPRMEDGNLDGGFFAIFTKQGPLTAQGYAAARRHALQRSAEIDAMLARFSDRIQPARTAGEARAIDAGGKLVAFKSMENSYPLGPDVKLLAQFQRQGVRLAGPVHTRVNQFSDSATDQPRWHGLSPLGRKWVAEMNRLGMVIDGSHASDQALEQMIALSKTPLLLSHSSPRAMFNHPRNIDDAHIRQLAAKGGAVCVSTIYLSEGHMEGERGELFDQIDDIATLDPAQQRKLGKRWHELDQSAPIWDTTFAQYMAAVKHVIEVAGVDHVCFGADFDGGGGIDGVKDISELPHITAALKAAGYTDDDLAKMWSGNVLRILGEAERHAGSLR
jgi:membrane dipeptidase